MGSDPDVVFPPLKQVKAGVPIQDIQCKEELFLLYKAKTLSPACVSGDSKGELLLRGWGLLRIVNPGEIITQELLCKSYPNAEFVQRSCKNELEKNQIKAEFVPSVYEGVNRDYPETV
jgi:hypothetical protein